MQTRWPVREVLLAIDGSSASAPAVDRAVQAVLRDNARLTLLALEPSPVGLAVLATGVGAVIPCSGVPPERMSSALRAELDRIPRAVSVRLRCTQGRFRELIEREAGLRAVDALVLGCGVHGWICGELAGTLTKRDVQRLRRVCRVLD